MRRKVYVETSIASYLTARPSRDPVVRGRQELTQEWWREDRMRFDLFVSALVIREMAQGDREASQKRLAQIDGIPTLPISADVVELAQILIRRRIVPEQAFEDAIHVAVASHYGLDFVLTWNCRHIANAEVMRRLEDYCLEAGLRLPILCTPQQLMPNYE